MAIRFLKDDEPTPQGQPRRYLATNGYIKLRWRVGDDCLEIYEHRLIAGRPRRGLQVHHRNGDKTDNRPENLTVVTPAEHKAHHRRLDYQHMADLYAQGLSTPEVAAIVGTDQGAVSRALRKIGVKMRDSGCGNRRHVAEPERICRMHQAGMRPSQIASETGYSEMVVRRVVRDAGLPSHKPGRPRKRDGVSAA